MSIKKVKLIGNKGQTLVEALVAIGIFLISINAIIFLIFAAQSISGDTKINQKAINYATEGIEAIRSIRNRDWDELTDGEHGLVFSGNQWNFSGVSDQKENLNRKITITAQANDIKNIKSLITWQTETSRPQKIELVAIITNKQAAIENGGDGGGTPPTGNWQAPQTLGSVDLGAGNSATDLDVKNKIVYLTAEASATAKPDFFIVNAADGQNPFIVSSLNVGEGLKSLDIAGDYAYVVGTDDDKAFAVIDISNLSAPVEVASLDLPGDADALTIFYRNNHVYIGREYGAPQEFLIINVSDPLNPSLVSGLSGVGGEINDIYVLNNRAYLGTEENSRGMIIIDIANLVSPSIMGSINVSDDVYGIYPKSEDNVLVGEKTKFYIINATDASNMTTVGSALIGNRTRDIVSAGSLAFLATENPNAEFQIFDISNPANPSLWTSFNFPQTATGIDYEDNVVYVSVKSNDGLRIISSTP
ncbi:MAG: hypothetical protein AAB404_02535 [Patescibacteria group bacterium]